MASPVQMDLIQAHTYPISQVNTYGHEVTYNMSPCLGCLPWNLIRHDIYAHTI